MSKKAPVKLIAGLDEKAYHKQSRQRIPKLTYSTVKTIATKSAYHAWLNHPMLGGVTREPTKAMDKGSVIHSLILGGGQDIKVIMADSYRTKSAKEARDEAYELGFIPMLEKEIEPLHVAAEEVSKKIKEIAPYFFDKHESELTVRYELDGVKCQSRWDWISPEQNKLIDLKTTKDSSPDGIEKTIYNFGYDIQEAMYTRAAELAFPELAGRWKWEFIFCEIEPPYMVSIIETDSVMKQLGNMRLDRGIKTWKECMNTKTWPGYGRVRVSAPGWAMSKEEGRE